MSEEDNKILKDNHGEKSKKVPFTIYGDLESLLEKMNTCHNNPGNDQHLKYINTYHLVIPCLDTVHLIQQKRQKLYGKRFSRFKRTCNKNNQL